ncbi:MAG: hypothetical protein O2783_07045 [Chloroflexi bacterium]|nr:hypothetical protein [Chloroflexota bacterium]
MQELNKLNSLASKILGGLLVFALLAFIVVVFGGMLWELFWQWN